MFCALRTPLQRSEKLLAARYVKWELSLALWPWFSKVLKPLTQRHANCLEVHWPPLMLPLNVCFRTLLKRKVITHLFRIKHTRSSWGVAGPCLTCQRCLSFSFLSVIVPWAATILLCKELNILTHRTARAFSDFEFGSSGYLDAVCALLGNQCGLLLVQLSHLQGLCLNFYCGPYSQQRQTRIPRQSLDPWMQAHSPRLSPMK